MGDYRDAREWMAMSVPTLQAAVTMVARALVRPSTEPEDVRMCARYLQDAIVSVRDAEENLMRAKLTLEKLMITEGEVQ